MLEGIELEYEVVPVTISTGDQFEQNFLRISPNDKMPAIVDHAGVGGNEANKTSIFESEAIYTVMDRRLGDYRYFAGAYSIADIAIFPWVVPHDNQGQDLESYPNLKRWYQEIQQYPCSVLNEAAA